MQIKKRLVSTKKHTLGFLVGGKWRTRSQAVKLAEKGKISNVIVRRSPYGKYISAVPDTPRLSDLPEMHRSRLKTKQRRVFAKA